MNLDPRITVPINTDTDNNTTNGEQAASAQRFNKAARGNISTALNTR